MNIPMMHRETFSRTTYLYICDRFTLHAVFLYTKRQKEASQMKQVFSVYKMNQQNFAKILI